MVASRGGLATLMIRVCRGLPPTYSIAWIDYDAGELHSLDEVPLPSTHDFGCTFGPETDDGRTPDSTVVT